MRSRSRTSTCQACTPRFCNFVSWVRPDPDKREDTVAQRDEVWGRIRGQAEKDGLTVRSTPNSGSFAKRTGLRRHMLGGAEHEGQDIDCPFVVSPRDEDGDALTELLGRFERYAKASYPDTACRATKSSVRLDFVASRRSFDIVPMLAVPGRDDEQILLRANGERRRTSIQKHVDFASARTKKSQVLQGPVAFNDAVRLVKWWREVRVGESRILTEVPTFFVDLLCAKAFDETSVRATYPDTLENWFDKIQSYAANRADIAFADFTTPTLATATGKWKVIDPVNGTNNVVPAAWGGIEFDEFRDWAYAARDKVRSAIACDLRGQEARAVDLMSEVFGSSFKHHSEA
jgi:hypothetical protein